MTQKTKIIVEQNHEQKLEKFEPRYKELVLEAKELKIVNEETNKRGVDLVRELKELFKWYESFLEMWIGDFKVAVKKREKIVKPYMKSLKEIIGKDSYNGLRGQLADYETKRQEEANKEEERLRIKQQKEYDKKVVKAEKKDEIPPPPPPPIKVETNKEKDVSYRDDWTYDKENIELSKVPETLMGVSIKMLDDKAVSKLIKGGVREIPGLRIFAKKVPIIREEKLEDL